MKEFLKTKAFLKKLAASLLSSLLICSSLNLAVCAEKREDYGAGGRRFTSAVLRITKGGGDNSDWQEITGDGDKNIGIMRSKELEIINNSSGIISFETDFAGVKSEHIKSPKFGVYADFAIYTDSEKWYSCAVDVVRNPLITVDKLLKSAEIPASDEVKAVVVLEQDNFDSSWFDNNDGYRAFFNCTNFIKGVRVVNTARKGWTEADKIHWNDSDSAIRKFYVDKTNHIISNSCSIGGIRYKFGADGICGGKYTGWTKSSQGSRYWKNGVLCKNKWATTKDGSKYYLGRTGYPVTGTVIIKGRVYQFDDKGKCLDKV